MDSMIGKTVGKYRIVEHLGRGGMAEVYKAYQPSLDRYVAVKMMHAFLADEKEFLARFEREARVVATLRHPNIVQVYDFDVESGVYFMVMEFINGETLKTRMQELEAQGQWISLDDAGRIILAVGSALKYAHERGMVHRDVKPANVMITTDGSVILTDFGIAKIVSASNLTASGAMVGTPSYMAPEQGMGQPGDERSDIYSLGVMLYQLALGRLPYDADTPLAVVLKHINEPLPLPQAIKPDLSDELNRVILKSLAKDPADRYQKVGEMLADLRRALGMSPEDSQPDAGKGAAIKLGGATMAAKVGVGLTPAPKTAPGAAADQSGTQVAAPKTIVAGAAAASTAIVGTGDGSSAAAAGAAAAPPIEKQRPGWLIPVIVIAVIAVVGIGALVVLGGGAAGPAPTLSPTATLPQATATAEPPTATATQPPITTQLFALAEATDLRDKAGTDNTSQVQGLLAEGTQFFVKARTTDNLWLRIETPDGTTGWLAAASAGLTADQIQQIPVASTLIRPTDTPTPTSPPTEAFTPTPEATATFTPAPTRTRAPTRPPGPPPPATTPNVPPPPPPSPTPGAGEQLGYGFEFQFCTYDGENYTCNVRVWGSGGTPPYHFALENPDTGNWDEKAGGSANYLMRSRRCRIRVQQLRLWDEAGNHMEPNLTMDPNVMPDRFPGGAGCTE
jgi:tRNA A-37 threonylcarbamoyl transferase component Bud32